MGNNGLDFKIYALYDIHSINSLQKKWKIPKTLRNESNCVFPSKFSSQRTSCTHFMLKFFKINSNNTYNANFVILFE